MPLNFATKAFSYNLARFWISLSCKLYNILLADSFPIFSCVFSFPFSLPFFSLYLLPFIPFLSTGKVLASALLKTWKSNIDQVGDLAYFTTDFAPKIRHLFSGIALPEFLSLLCYLLIKTIWWRQKWWRHKWLNVSGSKTTQKYYSWRER